MTLDAYSLSEFGTRGAVFTAASLLVLGGTLGWWWWTTRRTVHRELDVSIRILVTGTRGKSSLVRLLHGALLAAGQAPYAKMTGTHAAEIRPDGSEQPTRRIGQISVLETLDTARRAVHGDPPPTALVFESMGVRPELIRLIAARMTRPTITVITNALHDHLEEEGSTTDQVADALSEAIGPDTELVVTGETEPGPLAQIRRHAGEAQTHLIESRRTPAPEWVRDAVPDAHPSNLAMALAVTRHLGIDDETAVAGMRSAAPEPIDRLVVDIDLDGFALTYIDLGSVNDVDSLRTLLAMVEEQRRGRPLIAEVVARWDRPLRALQFAGFLQPDRWAGAILVGDAAHPVHAYMRRAGFPRSSTMQVSILELPGDVWRPRVDRFIRRLGQPANGCVIVRLQNIHDPVADRLLETIHQLATAQETAR